MFGFRTKPDLGNKTRQHAYGQKKQARPRAEKQQFEYAYLFGSVVAEEKLVRLSLSLG